MNTNEKTSTQDNEEGKPWWHYGHAWLVFGGPAAVVVASLFTVYLAVSTRDTLVDENYYNKGININQQLDANAEQLSNAARNALEPAQLARNHAATGVHTED